MRDENIIEWSDRIDGYFDKMRVMFSARQDGRRHAKVRAAFMPPDDPVLAAQYRKGFEIDAKPKIRTKP